MLQEASRNGGENSKLYSYPPITLKFLDVSFRIKLHESNKRSRIFSTFAATTVAQPVSDVENPTAHERLILNGITGTAAPGKILAVLGPSGSGKSTLLNAISGRLHRRELTGKILYNDWKLTKSVQENIGFVAQEDVFYHHLTVRETLVFCSLLRLPASLPKREKIAAVDSIISELNLTKCADTVVGEISGGERKRVSIAHEMLVDPTLLILDEPTSGLDSTSAYGVVATLGELAARGKTVVTSVHQPSSRAYQLFDELLVLSEGKCIYFGKGSEATSYFNSIGFSPSFPMNPADFLLDLANGIYHVDGGSERERPNVRETLASSYNTSLAPKVKMACLETSNMAGEQTRIPTTPNTKLPWFNQLTILIQRNLKAKKQETFNSLRLFHVIFTSFLAGLMWFRSDRLDVQDRLGLLFFVAIFWGVLPSFNAVFVFSQDRAILTKERSSGMHTLSSYFVARITSDLPTELILPTLFLCITYPIVGLKPDLFAFVTTLAVVLGYVLVSQGLGLALGALIVDVKKASVVVTVVMLAFVLTGGFYVHKLPVFGYWMKYVSTTFYCYELLVYVQYGDGASISSMLGCSGPQSDRDPAACRFVRQNIAGQIHPAVSACMLLVMFVAYRVLAYVALKRVRV